MTPPTPEAKVAVHERPGSGLDAYVGTDHVRVAATYVAVAR